MGAKIASFERALLESLGVAKGGARSRLLTQIEIETRLEPELVVMGETRLNEIRDRARAISIRTGKAVEFSKLDRIIGALLGTKQANLKSQVGKARALGQAFDINCLNRLTALLSEIKNTPLHEHANFKVAAHVSNKAFFENRPNVNPGRFKESANRADSTEFVRPDHVDGTLSRGFELYRSLPEGLSRAMFIPISTEV